MVPFFSMENEIFAVEPGDIGVTLVARRSASSTAAHRSLFGHVSVSLRRSREGLDVPKDVLLVAQVGFDRRPDAGDLRMADDLYRRIVDLVAKALAEREARARRAAPATPAPAPPS